MTKTLNDGLILVLNCGSSSIKFAVFDTQQAPLSRDPLWKGKVQGIGGPTPQFEQSGWAVEDITLDAQNPYRSGLALIRERVLERLGQRRLGVIGHRVVHGGSKYFSPVRIDHDVLADLQRYIPLAPLHQPFALEAIEILLTQHPDLPQVACFDTCFHHTIPQVEQVLPLPFDAWERGLRRYGFHGLSYEYLSRVLEARHGSITRGRVIAAHLGSGASLCAMYDGQSQATTMGFSALDGLMMGTRTGALDPGALLYLMETEQLSVKALGDMLYHRSGLLGVSGLSAEPHVVVQHEEDPGEQGARARLALDLYVRRIVREIGALMTVLGGLDLLVFTAGVGEHNDFIRARVCQALAFLGVVLEPEANQRHAATISAPDSAVVVAVEPTNEEWVVACHAQAVCAVQA